MDLSTQSESIPERQLALAVGLGLHERRGWQPTLRVQNDSGAMVVLEDLEAWWRLTQSAAPSGA
jgi:hypothetical protein